MISIDCSLGVCIYIYIHVYIYIIYIYIDICVNICLYVQTWGPPCCEELKDPSVKNQLMPVVKSLHQPGARRLLGRRLLEAGPSSIASSM